MTTDVLSSETAHIVVAVAGKMGWSSCGDVSEKLDVRRRLRRMSSVRTEA
jgi:hypothetical protein